MADDSEESDSSVVPTQTERDILDTLHTKYGDLSRDIFIGHLCGDVHQHDLISIRRSLYDLALQTISDTPRGTLAMRKDTQNNGGASAMDKLADDVYTLTHYLQGDTSMDVMKCLSEKSKKKLLKTMQGSSAVPVSANSLNHPNTPHEQDSDVDTYHMPIREFCVQIITEMRRDRDILHHELTALHKDSALLRKVTDDVAEMRREIAETRDRICKVEVYIQEGHAECSLDNSGSDTRKVCKDLQKSVKKLQKRASVLDNDMDTIRSTGSDIATQVANNNAALTRRINNMDLMYQSSTSQHHKPKNVTAHPTTSQIRNVISTAENIHSERNAGIVTRTIQTSDDSLKVTVADTLSSTSTDVRSHTSHPPRMLKGYAPREQRQKYKVFFVSGIYRQGDNIDDDIACTTDYMEHKGCQVKSVRKLKHGYQTMSVKIVVHEESAPILMDSQFWPDGIQCREWVD